MSINTRVQQVLDQGNGDPEIRRLLHFYRMKESEGAVLRRGYGLPMLDTVGRDLPDTDRLSSLRPDDDPGASE